VLFFWQLDICIEKFKLSENVQNAVNGYLSVPLYRHHPLGLSHPFLQLFGQANATNEWSNKSWTKKMASWK